MKLQLMRQYLSTLEQSGEEPQAEELAQMYEIFRENEEKNDISRPANSVDSPLPKGQPKMLSSQSVQDIMQQ